MAFLSLQPRAGVLGSDILYQLMEITLTPLLTVHVGVKLKCSVTSALLPLGRSDSADLLKIEETQKNNYSHNTSFQNHRTEIIDYFNILKRKPDLSAGLITKQSAIDDVYL